MSIISRLANALKRFVVVIEQRFKQSFKQRYVVRSKTFPDVNAKEVCVYTIFDQKEQDFLIALYSSQEAAQEAADDLNKESGWNS
jgi:hypothetical protein